MYVCMCMYMSGCQPACSSVCLSLCLSGQISEQGQLIQHLEIQDAGAKRVLFHPEPASNAPAWHVLSRMCGNPWRQETSDYWPEDTWREDVEGYGVNFHKAQKKDG